MGGVYVYIYVFIHTSSIFCSWPCRFVSFVVVDRGFELSDEDYGEQEKQPQASPSAAAAAAVVYGSSGDEGGCDWGRVHSVARDSVRNRGLEYRKACRKTGGVEGSAS